MPLSLPVTSMGLRGVRLVTNVDGSSTVDDTADEARLAGAVLSYSQQHGPTVRGMLGSRIERGIEHV